MDNRYQSTGAALLAAVVMTAAVVYAWQSRGSLLTVVVVIAAATGFSIATAFFGRTSDEERPSHEAAEKDEPAHRA